MKTCLVRLLLVATVLFVCGCQSANASPEKITDVRASTNRRLVYDIDQSDQQVSVVHVAPFTIEGWKVEAIRIHGISRVIGKYDQFRILVTREKDYARLQWHRLEDGKERQFEFPYPTKQPLHSGWSGSLKSASVEVEGPIDVNDQDFSLPEDFRKLLGRLAILLPMTVAVTSEAM